MITFSFRRHYFKYSRGQKFEMSDLMNENDHAPPPSHSPLSLDCITDNDSYNDRFANDQSDDVDVPFLSYGKNVVGATNVKSLHGNDELSIGSPSKNMEFENQRRGHSIRGGSKKSSVSSRNYSLKGSHGSSNESNVSQLFREHDGNQARGSFHSEKTYDSTSNRPRNCSECLADPCASEKLPMANGVKRSQSYKLGDHISVRRTNQHPVRTTPASNNHLTLTRESPPKHPLPLHEVLLEASRQQDTDLTHVIPNRYPTGQQIDVYVFSNDHQYEDLQEVGIKKSFTPRKPRLTSDSSSGSNSIIGSGRYHRSISDYMSSSASSYDSVPSFPRISSTKDDDLFCIQDHELFTNENHTSVNFQNTIHRKHKANRKSETNTLKPKKRRYLKQHSSKSESNDKNDFLRVKQGHHCLSNGFNDERMLVQGILYHFLVKYILISQT